MTEIQMDNSDRTYRVLQYACQVIYLSSEDRNTGGLKGLTNFYSTLFIWGEEYKMTKVH